MLKTPLDNLTSQLQPGKNILLSPFSSQEHLSLIINHQCNPIFYDTTLQGCVDLNSFKKIDLTNISHLIYKDFFGNTDDLEETKTFCDNHNIIFVDHSVFEKVKSPDAFESYCEHFTATRDFTFRKSSYHASIFPIFLEPQFFCTKEAIVIALEEAGIDLLFTQLLYKSSLYLEHFKACSLFGASECHKSFIGLPLDIDKTEADRISKVVLEVFDKHSLRRCTF